jgi:hypothetical protein
VRVWRVENAEGAGPYRNDAAPPHCDGYTDPESHPAPRDDFAVFFKEEDEDGYYEARDELIAPYVFGFPTREAALRWFDDYDLAYMAERGYVLREMESDEVYVSDSGRQCMFRRR